MCESLLGARKRETVSKPKPRRKRGLPLSRLVSLPAGPECAERAAHSRVDLGDLTRVALALTPAERGTFGEPSPRGHSRPQSDSCQTAGADDRYRPNRLPSPRGRPGPMRGAFPGALRRSNARHQLCHPAPVLRGGAGPGGLGGRRRLRSHRTFWAARPDCGLRRRAVGLLWRDQAACRLWKALMPRRSMPWRA